MVKYYDYVFLWWQSWIFSIRTLMSHNPSEIILICWFSAQQLFSFYCKIKIDRQTDVYGLFCSKKKIIKLRSWKETLHTKTLFTLKGMVNPNHLILFSFLLNTKRFLLQYSTVYLPRKYWLNRGRFRGRFRVSTGYYPVIVVTKIST